MANIDEQCSLLEGIIDYSAQLLLFIIAFFGLILKRYKENPQRPWKIWMYDVSKQVFSGLAAHLCNMALAEFVALDYSESSPCSWYFIVFTVDTTLGVTLTLLFHHMVILAIDNFLKKTYLPFRMEWMENIVKCGQYGNPPRLSKWTPQMIEWVSVTIFARVICAIFIVLTRNYGLETAASTVDSIFGGHHTFQLYTVMIICPVLMNLIQALIQDSCLKFKEMSIKKGLGENEISSPEVEMRSESTGYWDNTLNSSMKWPAPL